MKENDGLAPKLLDFVCLPSDWYMVVMENLVSPWRMLSNAPEDWKENARQSALAALQLAHSSDVFGPGLKSVHGDARDSNIMVLPVEGQPSKCHVHFIDFDWSGQEGVARYPLLMSTKIPWAQNAGDQQVMRQEHDVFLLTNGGRSALTPNYSWRKDMT